MTIGDVVTMSHWIAGQGAGQHNKDFCFNKLMDVFHHGGKGDWNMAAHKLRTMCPKGYEAHPFIQWLLDGLDN